MRCVRKSEKKVFVLRSKDEKSKSGVSKGGLVRIRVREKDRETESERMYLHLHKKNTRDKKKHQSALYTWIKQ